MGTVVQRRQRPARATDPVAQGRRSSSMPWRTKTRAFDDHHMRQQGLGRHAADDSTLGRLHNPRRAAASVMAWPADHPHPDVFGDVTQHLGLILADQMQLPAEQGPFLSATSISCSIRGRVRRQRARIAFGRVAAGCTSMLPTELAGSPAILPLRVSPAPPPTVRGPRSRAAPPLRRVSPSADRSDCAAAAR